MLKTQQEHTRSRTDVMMLLPSISTIAMHFCGYLVWNIGTSSLELRFLQLCNLDGLILHYECLHGAICASATDSGCFIGGRMFTRGSNISADLQLKGSMKVSHSREHPHLKSRYFTDGN
jgi:hypothetical protein